MFGLGRHLVAGRVIAKRGYAASPLAAQASVTKLNAVMYEGIAPALASAPEDDGTYILRVDGTDQHGKPITQDKYVDELTFNTTEIGDSWPRTLTQ